MYRCKKCGEEIDNLQVQNHQGLCPSCFRDSNLVGSTFPQNFSQTYTETMFKGGILGIIFGILFIIFALLSRSILTLFNVSQFYIDSFDSIKLPFCIIGGLSIIFSIVSLKKYSRLKGNK